jgi:nitrite reductase (NO-forming)
MAPIRFISAILLLSILISCNNNKSSVFEETGPETPAMLEHVKQELVDPPALPEHNQVAEGEPKVVEVRMVIEEKKIEVAPGAKIWALTYEGTVPGPMIVVHKNDYVKLTLVNPADNKEVHNIDFHASTGALGGAELSKVAPGQEATIRFKATKTGTFIYHCAPGGIMTPLHIVSGMNGAIMVLPRDGLKDENGDPVRYDKAYYIAEQDYYIPQDEDGNYKDYESPAKGFVDMQKTMKELIPTHLVFNGKSNALVGENALTAEVGDKVLFITSQANRDTRIHLIGGHADLVWPGGSFNDKPATNYETWAIPGGTAVPALYQFRQPGKYLYLNHNLIEAVQLGAKAEVQVEGTWNNNLMKQVEEPAKIQEE